MFKSIKNHFNKKRLKDSKYLYLFDEPNTQEFVCFDCETTGLNPKTDDIISIGAVLIKNNKILTSQRFEKLIKPNTSLQSEAIKIHHIRKKDLQNAKEADEVIGEFLEFIKNRTLVGYYLEFDVAMINKHILPKLGITLPNKCIEVSSLYYDYKIEAIPQGHVDLRFNTIVKNLDIPNLAKHDALNDAIMTSMMFLKLKNISKKFTG